MFLGFTLSSLISVLSPSFPCARREQRMQFYTEFLRSCVKRGCVAGPCPMPGSGQAWLLPPLHQLLPCLGGTDQAQLRGRAARGRCGRSAGLELGVHTWTVHPVCESSGGLQPQALVCGSGNIGVGSAGALLAWSSPWHPGRPFLSEPHQDHSMCPALGLHNFPWLSSTRWSIRMQLLFTS